MSLDDDTTTLGEYFEPIAFVPAEPDAADVGVDDVAHALLADMRSLTARQMLTTPALADGLARMGWTNGTLAGATAPGPEAAEVATAGEFAARWNALPGDRRLEWVNTTRDLAAAGRRCQFELQHTEQIARLQELRLWPVSLDRVRRVAQLHTIADCDVPAVVALLRDLGVEVDA